MLSRYVDGLVEAHDAEHLTKFEELLEAAIDLDRIPDEYLICASYDAGLKVQYTGFFVHHSSMSAVIILGWLNGG